MTYLKQRFIDQGFRLERIIIVIDNTSIHLPKFSKDSIKKSNFQCLTIWLYSLSINPIEKLSDELNSNFEAKVIATLLIRLQYI